MPFGPYHPYRLLLNFYGTEAKINALKNKPKDIFAICFPCEAAFSGCFFLPVAREQFFEVFFRYRIVYIAEATGKKKKRSKAGFFT